MYFVKQNVLLKAKSFISNAILLIHSSPVLKSHLQGIQQALKKRKNNYYNTLYMQHGKKCNEELVKVTNYQLSVLSLCSGQQKQICQEKKPTCCSCVSVRRSESSHHQVTKRTYNKKPLMMSFLQILYQRKRTIKVLPPDL